MAEVGILQQYKPFFTDLYRYNVVYGGRGKGATWSIARGLLVEAIEKRHRILCTREFQNSINESVYYTLVEQISMLGLDKLFTIQKTYITSITGSEFIFKGLRHNIDSIKSMEGITRVWVAEADKVPQSSWDKLIPTIRAEGSKFYIDFNTDTEDDPVYRMFVKHKNKDAFVLFQTFLDNPYFPEVLRKEMENDKEYNYDKYLWVWEGKPRNFSDSCIFAGKFIVDDFTTIPEPHYMHGADWGFAHDPTAVIRCYAHEGCLYIDAEAYGVGVEIDDHPALFDTIPTTRSWPIIADSARPELISYMKRQGFRISSAKKGKGSINAGIERIRNFKKVIIHPRCKQTIEEFKLYSYKVNSTTGDIMPIPEDKYNHCVDSLRYATERYKERKPQAENINMGALGL